MRVPKLRRKKVKGHEYWYTAAAGGAYFGKVGEVAHKDAYRQFALHTQKGQASLQTEAMTVAQLFHYFLEWIEENRSPATYQTRKRECNCFARFVYGDRKIADIPALEVTGDMLKSWRANLKVEAVKGEVGVNDKGKRGLVPQSLLHAETSVRHAFNWACKYPSPTSHLPVTFRPFRGIERTKPHRKALNESDLLFDPEVDALLEAAAFDVDQFRRWGIEKHIAKHGRSGMRPCKDAFGDMLRVYHATGARTSELAVAKVRDFSPRSHQIVLGKHKTSETQTTTTVRSITLGEEAFQIVKRRCQGRGLDEAIFLTAWGKPFTKKTLNTRLHSVRRIAVALGAEIRKDVTIYDFRHLWISDQLVAETALLTVARMAGTSVAMIENVYGHFRKDQLIEAQRLLEKTRRMRREKAANPDPDAVT